MHRILTAILLAALLLAGGRAAAQEELPRLAVNVELEGGASVFSAKSMRSDFPVGLMLDLGTELSTGRDLRVRLRPQIGLRLFSQDIERNIDEQFRLIRVGGAFSYDAYFVGQLSFFPFVALNFNWVNNYDAETVGYDSEGRPNIVTSDSFVKGRGVSTALGLKVQYQRFFARGSYDIFTPILNVRYAKEEEQIGGVQVVHYYYRREPFDLSAFNLSIGYILF